MSTLQLCAYMRTEHAQKEKKTLNCRVDINNNNNNNNNNNHNNNNHHNNNHNYNSC